MLQLLTLDGTDMIAGTDDITNKAFQNKIFSSI